VTSPGALLKKYIFTGCLVGNYFLPGAWLENIFYRVLGWKINFTGWLVGKYYLYSVARDSASLETITGWLTGKTVYRVLGWKINFYWVLGWKINVHRVRVLGWKIFFTRCLARK
jgi:hypothetical protein